MIPSSFVARAALAGWLLGGGAGCSVLLATDAEQCNVDADCTARGAAFAGTVCTANVCTPPPDPKWGCIGDVPALVSGGMFSFKMQIIGAVSMAPVSTLTIQLCSKLDTTCMTPLTTAPLAMDAEGNVSATVASDFEGYLDITDSSGTYLEALVFVDVVGVVMNPQVLLVPKTTEMGLAATAMVTVDPTDALLLVQTIDCTTARTAGASVSMTPLGNATPFYLIADTADATATVTDSAGNAGFINVTAPQDVTVVGTVGPGGKEYGRATTYVRNAAATYQILRPTTPP